MTFDAFVSYRRSDFAFAEGIFELCSAFGLNVFLDKRSLRPGRAWEASLLEALQNSRALLVLWSRSAASSSYMQREWRLVPPSCSVIPVRLDGSPLPDDLAHFQGLDGFGISGRILSRSLELTREQKLSRAQANEILLAELAEDGVELEPKQKRAVLGFVTMATSSALLLAVRQTSYFTRQLGGSLLSAKGGASLLGASLAFGAGSFFAGSGAPAPEPSPSLSSNVQAALPAPESAATCAALLEECRQKAIEPVAPNSAAPTAQPVLSPTSSLTPAGARTAIPSLSRVPNRTVTATPAAAPAITPAPTTPATTPTAPTTPATTLPSTATTALPSTATTALPSTATTAPPSTGMANAADDR